MGLLILLTICATFGFIVWAVTKVAISAITGPRYYAPPYEPPYQPEPPVQRADPEALRRALTIIRESEVRQLSKQITQAYKRGEIGYEEYNELNNRLIDTGYLKPLI